jgi:TolB protein
VGTRRLSFWSPDGQTVAFTRDDGIYVMNADGSGKRRRCTSPAEDCSGWAPLVARRTELAYQRKRGEYSDIHVVNADGSGRRRLTQRGVQPRWSSDGRKIGFTSSRDGNLEVYVMNADGSGRKRLTRTPARAELGLAWSPALK